VDGDLKAAAGGIGDMEAEFAAVALGKNRKDCREEQKERKRRVCDSFGNGSVPTVVRGTEGSACGGVSDSEQKPPFADRAMRG
jgi:hypothetical protein